MLFIFRFYFLVRFRFPPPVFVFSLFSLSLFLFVFRVFFTPRFRFFCLFPSFSFLLPFSRFHYFFDCVCFSSRFRKTPPNKKNHTLKSGPSFGEKSPEKKPAAHTRTSLASGFGPKIVISDLVVKNPYE